MFARTSRGHQVRMYYLHLEEIFANQVLDEMRISFERRLAIEKSESMEKARHSTLIASHPKTSLVYCVKVGTMKHGDNEDLIVKIGETDDIKTRITSLRSQYNKAILLDVFPCLQAHRFEQFIFHHPDMITRNLKEPFNGVRSVELFRFGGDWPYSKARVMMAKHVVDFTGMDCAMYLESRRVKLEESREERLRNAEERRQKFQDQCLTLLSQPDVSSQKMELIYALMRNNDPCHESETLSHIEEEVDEGDDIQQLVSFKSHRPSDPLIQQYDASDHTRLIATHDGIRAAARAICGKYTSVSNACSENTIYMGYRWFAIDRSDSDPNASRVIPSNAATRYRSGVVAQLTLDSSRIINTHIDMVRAAQVVGLRNSSSITIAINRNSIAKGYRWAMLDSCSQELKTAYDDIVSRNKETQDNGRQTQMIQSRGKSVQRLHPVTGVILQTYASMVDVCRDFRVSHKRLNQASKDGSIYKDFKWNVISLR